MIEHGQIGCEIAAARRAQTAALIGYLSYFSRLCISPIPDVSAS